MESFCGNEGTRRDVKGHPYFIYGSALQEVLGIRDTFEHKPRLNRLNFILKM